MTNIPPPLLGVELPAVVVALESADINEASIDNLINALPAPSIDKIWVRVRMPISIEELSSYLKLDEERLAKLNDVNEDHQFRQGDWLVVPSQQSRQIKQLAAIDTSELRRIPPLQSLPPVEERAVVRFGDTVVKIAQRYGLTLQELLRLNPGLETARLVVGSQVRLAQASSGRTPMVQGLKPTTSGGISWPELPSFNELNKPFISSPTIKPLSPNEQVVLQRIRSNNGGNVPLLVGVVQVPGQSGAAIFQLGGSTTSAAVGESIGSSGWRLRSASGDTAVIEKGGEQHRISISSDISSGYTPQWRTYGQCKYDWAGWKLHSNGTRTTSVDCGVSAMRWTVGVSCVRLLVAAHTAKSGWSKWRAPAGPGNKSRQGEDEMVAALCANV